MAPKDKIILVGRPGKISLDSTPMLFMTSSAPSVSPRVHSLTAMGPDPESFPEPYIW